MRFFALCALLAVTSAVVAQSSIPQPPPEALVTVATHSVPSAFVDLGAAPANLASGRVLLFLNRTTAQQAQLDAVIREQSDPASPEFHHFLTPRDFGQRFGPSAAAIQAVTQWLTASGFTINRVLDGRLAVEFTAAAPQLEAAFHTRIHTFAAPGDAGKVLYANATPPQVPATLAPYIKSVSLSNFAPQPLSRGLGSFLLHPSSGNAPSANATPLHGNAADPLFNITGYQPCAPTGVCYALVPGDVATIYDTKPLLAAGVDGTGVTIGIPSTSNIDLPTVQRFRTLFLPKYSATNLPNVILDGQDPGLLTTGTDEAYVDVETAGSVAPNATINLYAGASSAYTNGLTLALARAIEDNAISILSVSYGECEAYLGSYNAQFRDFYEQAAAQGITVVAASGDSGAAACDPPPNTSVSGPYQGTYGLAVNGLASTPYNVAVGGTDFLYPANATASTFNQYWRAGTATAPNNNADWSSALSYIPEKPWDDSNTVLDQLTNENFGGGGGGKSSCSFNDGNGDYAEYPAVCQGGYPKPAWQHGFGGDTVRDLPDVSFFSGAGGNYSFYAFCTYDPYFPTSSQCDVPNAGPNSTSAPIVISGFGGTSVATPLMAGILALVAEKTQTPRLGLATPTLYPLSQQFPAAFHDITSGTNSMACKAGSTDCGSDGFLTGNAATTGFDLASGLGSIDANQLVTNWNKVTATTQATSTTLTLTPTFGPHETVISFTVNVTGASSNPVSGAIAILSGATPTIQTTSECASFPCTFTFKGLPGGTYPVVARFLDDGTFASSTSAPFTVTITPEASELLILNAFNNNQNYPPNGLNGVTNAQLGQALGFTVAPAPLNTPADTSFFSINWPPATGTVTISDNGTPVGVPTALDTLGSFNFLSTTFGLGTHSLTVQYSGDSSYGPSNSSAPLATPLNFTVVKATPGGIYINGLPYYGGTAVGDAIPLIAYIQAATNQNNLSFPAPTGTLSVTVNGTALPPVSLTSSNYGQSQWNTNIPGNLVVLGTNTLQVSYPGDANYADISSQTSFQGIVFQTFADLNANPTTIGAGLPITFYPEVFRSYQQAEPLTIPSNVTVTLLDGATAFATVPLKTDTDRTEANATYAYSGLSVGTHTITLQYAGDAGDLPSTATTTVTITPGSPGFTLSATSITFPAGATSPSATSTLTITPINGFTGTVNLSCSGDTLPGGSCSVPATASISGSSASTITVTLSIHGDTAAQISSPKSFRLAFLPVLSACILLGITLPGARRRSRWQLFCIPLAAAFLLSTLTACGSGTNGSSGPTTPIAPGTYSTIIQATSGTLSISTSIPITVQ